MQFGPIFRALLKNRTRFWLILVEVALTLAIVVKGLDKVMNGELAIWAGYKNGKLRHVDPLTRVNLG